MKTQLQYFDGDNEQTLNYIHHIVSSGGSNCTDLRKMKLLLKRAVTEELTEMQRLCLTEYYFGNKQQTAIASELGICPATVCRHIKAAERRLKRIAKYYI